MQQNGEVVKTALRRGEEVVVKASREPRWFPFTSAWWKWELRQGETSVSSIWWTHTHFSTFNLISIPKKHNNWNPNSYCGTIYKHFSNPNPLHYAFSFFILFILHPKSCIMNSTYPLLFGAFLAWAALS